MRGRRRRVDEIPEDQAAVAGANIRVLRQCLLRDARHKHLAPPIVSTIIAVCFRARATAP